MSFGIQIYNSRGVPLLYEKGITPQIVGEPFNFNATYGTSFFINAPNGTFNMIFTPPSIGTIPYGGAGLGLSITSNIFTKTVEGNGVRYTVNNGRDAFGRPILVTPIITTPPSESHGLSAFDGLGVKSMAGVPSSTLVKIGEAKSLAPLSFPGDMFLTDLRNIVEDQTIDMIFGIVGNHIIKLPKSTYPTMPIVLCEIPDYPHAAAIAGPIRSSTTHWIILLAATAGHLPKIHLFGKKTGVSAGFGIIVKDGSGNIVIGSATGDLFCTVTPPATIPKFDLLNGSMQPATRTVDAVFSNLPNEPIMSSYAGCIFSTNFGIWFSKSPIKITYIMGAMLSRISQTTVRLSYMLIYQSSTVFSRGNVAYSTTYVGAAQDNVLLASTLPYAP